jgi:hypothetical protein
MVYRFNNIIHVQFFLNLNFLHCVSKLNNNFLGVQCFIIYLGLIDEELVRKIPFAFQFEPNKDVLNFIICVKGVLGLLLIIFLMNCINLFCIKFQT